MVNNMERKVQDNLQSHSYWYKDAIIYELHVRAFYDSNGDGIGDFPGLIMKLDYLANLGVTALWLLPFYPSPRKDDGYDISDYFSIHPEYGTMKDFKEFLKQAHMRGLKVITELVINHTSDQHMWFQKSRQAKPGSYWHNFYVWSADPAKYKEARIIFKDYENSNWQWDPIAKSYYWHRFYSHQPDLNYDNLEVQKQVIKVVDFWFDLGVDGMRLDAVPYIFERDKTGCENLPETHAFLKNLRRHVDKHYKDRMLLSEANQWPEDAVAYFGQGDECHMNFHFPLMPRLFMALCIEDRYCIVDIIKQTPEIPANCQWATFLRNHDELTLEMVTDEERDYMYKAYASDPKARINLGIRRRLVPLLENDRKRVELLNGLLFSLVGAPVLYYGDEIGMGDNIYLGDRDGVRTPFQWSSDKNAGFSKANPQSLYLPIIISPEYHYETVNVENQLNNANSLLWWMRRLILRRNQYLALQRGELKLLYPENYKVLAFLKIYQNQTILVVANLSRNVQCVELDLSEYKGRRPLEIFGQTEFPLIGELPYFLTIGSFGFYWFDIQESNNEQRLIEIELSKRTPIKVPSQPIWALKTAKELRLSLERELILYLTHARWFRGKTNKLSKCQIDEIIFVPPSQDKNPSAFLIISVYYSDQPSVDLYSIVICHAQGEHADHIRYDASKAVIAETISIEPDEKRGVYYNGFLNPKFGDEILNLLLKRKSLSSYQIQIQRDILGKVKKSWWQDLPSPRMQGFEQSNTSLVFGNRFYLKFFRKLEEGENPEIEIGRFLTEKNFEYIAPYIASLSYTKDKKSYSLAVLQRFVESEEDAWHIMLSRLEQFAEISLTRTDRLTEGQIDSSISIINKFKIKPNDYIKDVANYDLGLANLLGKRLAELHLALADDKDQHFVSDMYTPFYQRGLYQSLVNQLKQTMSLLSRAEKSLKDLSIQQQIGRVGSLHNRILSVYSFLKEKPISSARIRIHGDCHLGQIRFTGKDFVFIDFEGEPQRSISERKIKKTPLTDVAGLLRSFDYCYRFFLKNKNFNEEDYKKLTPICHIWMLGMGHCFISGYFDELKGKLIPEISDDFYKLLEILLIDKALYEIRYELGSRPEWIDITLLGLLDIMGEE